MARKFRKKFRKRRGKKRRHRKSKFTRVSIKGSQVIPDKLMVKLAYTDLLQRGGSSTDEYVFRGNSLFDPDFTSTGTQPLGFDQYSAFYGEYKVYSSKISLQIVNNTSVGMNVSLLPTMQSGGAGSFIVSCQQPYVRYKFAGGISAQSKIFLKSYMSSTKMWGRPVAPEDNFTASITGNPVNVWFWVIEMTSSDESTVLDYDMLVKVVYYVEFSKRLILAAS